MRKNTVLGEVKVGVSYLQDLRAVGDGPHSRVVVSARTAGPELASGPDWLAAACYGREHRLAGCITQGNHCSCRCSTEAGGCLV